MTTNWTTIATDVACFKCCDPMDHPAAMAWGATEYAAMFTGTRAAADGERCGKCGIDLTGRRASGIRIATRTN